MQYYFLIGGQQQGPYSAEEVQRYVASGQLQANDPGWCDGLSAWRPLSEFTEFMQGLPKTQRSHPARTARVRQWYRAVGLVAAALLICSIVSRLGWQHLHATRRIEADGKAARGGEATALNSATAAQSAHAPTTLEELNRWYTEPPQGRNAATPILEGISLEQISRGDRQDLSLPLLGRGSWPSPTEALQEALKRSIGDLVNRNQFAWQKFQQGSRLEEGRYPIDLTRGMGTLMPHLVGVKQGVDICVLRALYQAELRQADEAGASVAVALGLGHSLAAEPVLPSQAVRAGCISLAVAGLAQAASRVQLGAQTLAGLDKSLSALEAEEARGESFSRCFLAERVVGQVLFDLKPDQLQEILRRDFQGAGPSEQRQALAALRRGEVTDLNGQRKFFTQLIDDALQVRQQPFPGRLEADKLLISGLATAKEKKYYLCELLLGYFGSASAQEARALAQLRLARTLVAIERFYATHGLRFPGSLTELIPALLPELPANPFDGRSLDYQKISGGFKLSCSGPQLTGPRPPEATWPLVLTGAEPGRVHN